MELEKLIYGNKQKNNIIKMFVLLIILIFLFFSYIGSDKSGITLILCIFIFIAGINFFIKDHRIKNHKRKELFDSLSTEELSMINKELKKPILYVKHHHVLTDNYIINLKEISIISYKEIIWIYQKPFVLLTRYGGVDYYLIIITTDGCQHKFRISTSAITIGYELKDFSDVIKEKNKKVLVDYTVENIKTIKEKYNIELKW